MEVDSYMLGQKVSFFVCFPGRQKGRRLWTPGILNLKLGETNPKVIKEWPLYKWGYPKMKVLGVRRRLPKESQTGTFHIRWAPLADSRCLCLPGVTRQRRPEDRIL